MLTTCLKLKLLLKTSSQLYVKLVYVIEIKLQVSIKFIVSILLVSRKRKLLVATIPKKTLEEILKRIDTNSGCLRKKLVFICC